MAFLKRLIRALPLLLLSPFLMAISFLALVLVQLFTRRGGRIPPPADVAQALVPAVSRRVSTPVRGGDIVSKAGVGMRADAAGMSACVTSQRNTCEKRRLSMPQAVEVCYGKLPSDDCALGLNAGVGSHGSHLRFERESAAAGGAEFSGLLHGTPLKTPRCRGFWGTG